MSDLTPERRAELRNAALGRASLTVLANDLAALLDAADERDRLLTVADTLGRVNGEYAMEIHRCRESLGVDEDTDPHHAAQALAAAVERVRALHKPGDLMAWSEDCDDPEGHQWIDDPHGGGMLCADEISGAYCMGCVPDESVDMSDYPHPCATLRALDGTEDGPTT